jgi:hypothetical protein
VAAVRAGAFRSFERRRVASGLAEARKN